MDNEQCQYVFSNVNLRKAKRHNNKPCVFLWQDSKSTYIKRGGRIFKQGVDAYSNTTDNEHDNKRSGWVFKHNAYFCGKIPRAQISELSSTAAHIDDACSAAPQCSDGEVYVYARSCLPSQFCFGAWPDERSVMKKNKRLYNGDTYT